MEPVVLQAIIGKLIILVLSIAVHEFGHAYVADRLGDRLPRQQGRVTLNPLAHADPIGTLLLPVMGLVMTQGASTGFGWGRPVETLPNSYTRRFKMATGHMFVAAAGPIMNLFFGTFLGLVLFGLVKGGVVPMSDLYVENSLASMIAYAAFLNYVLMFFNLVPAPPLDGGAVIRGLLSYKARPYYDDYAKYGLFVVAAVILIPTLSQIFIWPATQLFRLVVGNLLRL